MRERFRQFNQKGFTLIELMATLAILALIIAIAIPAVGNLLTKADKSADDSSIELMERAGELADVAKLPHDGGEGDPLGDVINAETGEAETEAYRIPTLIKEGYLNMELDNKFNQPENYVVKVNKSGTYVYKGAGQRGGGGSGDGSENTDGNDSDYVSIGCPAAESDGYICIFTPEDLNNVRNNIAAKYMMMNDIDLSGFALWSPIGDATTPFAGELHGNGYTITNLSLGDSVNSEAIVGLFGVLTSGTFQELEIADYTLTTGDETSYAGALAGRVISTMSNNPEQTPIVVKNVTVSGETVIGGDGQIGGLFGYIDYANSDLLISGVTAALSVTNTETSGDYHTFGGLIGTAYVDAGMPDVPLDWSITDTVLDLDVVTNGDASGLIGEYDAYESWADLTIADVTVKGSMVGGSTAVGFIGDLTSDDSNIDVAVSDVAMSAALHAKYRSSPTAAGLFSNVSFTNYTGEARTGNVSIENVVVSGALSGESTNDSGAVVIGVMDNYSPYDMQGGITMDNVLVSSSMTGDNKSEVSAIMGNYDSGSEHGTQMTDTFKNITVTGAMSGTTVAGFAYNFDTYEGNLAITLDQFTLSGDMAGVNISGLFNNFNMGMVIMDFEATNITIDSNMNGSETATGLINWFNPYSGNDTDDFQFRFNHIDINGDMTAPIVSGFIHGFWPEDDGLMDVSIVDISVGGVLTGETVAGFVYNFVQHGSIQIYDLSSFLLDGFDFTGSMVAENHAAGLFTYFNEDSEYDSYLNRSYHHAAYPTFESYYTEYNDGLMNQLDYTFKNINIGGTVSVANGETGSYGGLIGKHHTERRGNDYLFQNINVTSDVTVTNENTATFKRGLIADPGADGYAELIFENVQ